jgi:hypothetical protein
MHFEILVEDQSGKKALDYLVPKIIGTSHTFVVHPYKGIGRIPRDMRDAQDASRRTLLENLPKLLKGYGRTQAGRQDFPETVILVCDLDDKCLKTFLEELNGILAACNPKPETRFCFAIEEGEAWFMGDVPAVKSAYPDAKEAVLNSYVNDSICGTWEKLADAVYPGGSSALAAKGWQAIGAEKSKWAEAITPRMVVENNKSPSFCHFLEKIRELT